MRKTVFKADQDSLDVTMERVFAATPDRVYAAYTQPDLIAHWWGPRAFTVRAVEMDVRPGGRWQIDLESPDGAVSSFHGYYHECRAAQLLVHTLEYSGMAGDVLLDTVRFVPEGQSTRVIAQSLFQTQRARQAMLKSGAEEGGTDGWDRLEEIVTRQGEKDDAQG